MFHALVLLRFRRIQIPVAYVIRTNFENKYVDLGNIAIQQRQYLYIIHFRVDTYTYAGMRNYDTTTKIGNGFFLEKVKDNQVFYNLRSDYIRWDTATRKWRAENAFERRIDGLKETVVRHQFIIVDLNMKPDELRRD